MAPADSSAPVRPCPICAKPASGRYRPFCSARCANVDLGRWLKGTYAVPDDEAPGIGDGTEDDDA